MSLSTEQDAKPSCSRPTIFLQAACYRHRYIRTRDHSAIVERPERLRAVALGLAAALARLESLPVDDDDDDFAPADADEDTLAHALEQLSIAAPQALCAPASIVHSTASLDLLHDPVVRFVHGDVYPAELHRWARDSRAAIARGASEVPADLPQGDLYLCPESVDAVQGAMGVVCEAVDSVVASAVGDRRAFVVVRPPGHHCGEDTPAGFCFVNNVAVGAAHAHIKHGVKRVVILDIDLHHGNGTQALVWRINEETHRLGLEATARGIAAPASLQMYYGSLHDVLSYPCEDGSAAHIAAASLCIHGAHGQHIENVHLQPYAPSLGERHFFDGVYATEYARILRRAAEFVERTGGAGDDVLVFISCGLDASTDEHASMARHARAVPPAFFARFARDAGVFADKYARGRLVSVLEGGYSERALVGGALAHLCGLVGGVGVGEGKQEEGEEAWWGLGNLVKLEDAVERRRRRRRRRGVQREEREKEGREGEEEPWVTRALEIFESLDGHARAPAPVPPSSMTLRARRTRGSVPEVENESENVESSSSDGEGQGSAPKRLPRVILRLGPDPRLTT